MQITDIKAQIKRAGRYSIFVDGKYAFSFSDTALLEHKLTIGRELTKEEIGKYKQLSQDDKLLGQVLRYTALRPRSVWEVQMYMTRKHCPAPQQQNILNKLTNMGYLDDETFARAWVEYRQLLKPLSSRRVRLELRQKRVADDTIDRVLRQNPVDDLAALRTMAEKKYRQSKYRTDTTKLKQYLARQGFQYDDIKTVVDELQV